MGGEIVRYHVTKLHQSLYFSMYKGMVSHRSHPSLRVPFSTLPQLTLSAALVDVLVHLYVFITDPIQASRARGQRGKFVE